MSQQSPDYIQQITTATAWIRGQGDLTSARIGILLRDKGVDPGTVICVKIFPDTRFPESGIVITPQKKIYQFGFNPSFFSPHQAVFDDWHDLTERYSNHQWRDEILAGLMLVVV